MDNEKLKKFLVPIALLALSLLALYYLGSSTITNVQNYMNTNSDLQTKTTTLEEKKQKLAQLQKAEADAKRKEEEARSNEAKEFYKPVMSGLDTEAVIAGEFTEILSLVRANKIKVRAIKYDYDPLDDAFVKGAAASYNVARLNMEMISDYASYENFLKELYKHDHFLDIQSVEIVPYKKNKSVLLINFKLKLYARK